MEENFRMEGANRLVVELDRLNKLTQTYIQTPAVFPEDLSGKLRFCATRRSEAQQHLQKLQSTSEMAGFRLDKLEDGEEEDQLQRKAMAIQETTLVLCTELREVLIIVDREKEIANDERLQAIQQGAPQPPAQPAVQQPAQQGWQIQLPPVQVEPFDGKIEKFKEFKQAVEDLLTNNAQIRPTQKMQMLKRWLKGEPAERVQHLVVDDQAFTTAITILEDEYGRSSRVKEHYRRRLSEVKAAEKSPRSEYKTLQLIKEYSRLLTASGENLNSTFFIDFILGHFSTDTVKTVINQSKDDPTPDLDATLLRLVTVINDANVEMDRLSAIEATRGKMTGRVEKPNNRSSQMMVAGKEQQKNPDPQNKNWKDQTKHQSKHSGHKHGIPKGLSRKSDERRKREFKCINCKLRHDAEGCKMPLNQRREVFAQEGRCTRCARENPGHLSKDCEMKCRLCQGPHHISLHNPNTTVAHMATNDETDENISLMIGTVEAEIALHTTKVTTQLRTFFDSGSSNTYMSLKTAQKLNLKLQNMQRRRVETFSGPVIDKFWDTWIYLKTRYGLTLPLPIRVRVRPIPTIWRAPVSDEDSVEIQQIFPDEEITKEGGWIEPELLIGVDNLFRVIYLRNSIVLPSGKIAMPSDGGLLIAGCPINDMYRLHAIQEWSMWPTPALIAAKPQKLTVNNDVMEQPAIAENSEFKEAIDAYMIGMTDPEVGSTKSQIREEMDNNLREFFNKTTALSQDNKVQVRLPVIESLRGEMSINLASSMKRMRTLYEKMTIKQKVKVATTIDEWKDRKMIELVPTPSPNELIRGLISYSPMGLAIKGDKIRPVFDFSAKEKGFISVNQALPPGPASPNNIPGLITRARKGKYLAIADLEKAFLKVQVTELDQDLTRFVWIKDPEKPFADNNVAHYKHRVIPFGTTSSSCLLAEAIRFAIKTARENNEDKAVFDDIENNLYVDNLLMTADTEAALLGKTKDAVDFFEKFGMHLCSIASNSPLVQVQMPEDRLLKDDNKLIPMLGMGWDTLRDEIVVTTKSQQVDVASRRSIASVVASSFDPLGWLDPVQLESRLFLQAMWRDPTGNWDKPVDELTQPFNEMMEVRGHFPLRMKRYLGEGPGRLAVFADASNKALAAVAYYVNREGKASLLMSRTKLAPLNGQGKIPKLELEAALLGLNLMQFVGRELMETDLRPEPEPAMVYSDSTIAIAQLKKEFDEAKLDGVFVSNRIKRANQLRIDMMDKLSLIVNVSHVGTTDNISDVCTRGLTPNQLIMDRRWIEAPGFLLNDIGNWPKQLLHLNDINREKVSGDVMLLVTAVPAKKSFFESIKPQTDEGPGHTLAEVQQKWTGTIRVVALVLKAIQRMTRGPRMSRRKWQILKEIDQMREGPLQAKDVQLAELAIIRDLQRNSWNNPHRELSQLNVIFDENQIVRMRPKVRAVDMVGVDPSPPVIPGESEIARRIVSEVHAQTHQGVKITQMRIRTQYWITKSLNLVKSVLKDCKDCQKRNARPCRYPASPTLPAERTKAVIYPFFNCGVDFAGPFFIKDQQGEKTKQYVTLFVCLNIRAVHLEVTTTMSAKAFMQAMIRFVSRRGLPQSMISDNAPTFIMCNDIVNLILLNEENPASKYMANKGFNWHNIPAYAPWFGGVYERLVAGIKEGLKASLRKTIPNFDLFATALADVEAILNSRPLCDVETGDSWEVIRPIDFLQRGAQIVLPRVIDDQTHIELEEDLAPMANKGRMELLELLTDNQRTTRIFQERLEKFYLPNLTHKKRLAVPGATRGTDPPLVGEIIMLKITPMAPRQTWPLAKVLELIKSRDGQVRSARLMLPSRRETTRPINQIYRLEMNEGEDEKEPKVIPPGQSIRRHLGLTSVHPSDPNLELDYDAVDEGTATGNPTIALSATTQAPNFQVTTKRSIIFCGMFVSSARMELRPHQADVDEREVDGRLQYRVVSQITTIKPIPEIGVSIIRLASVPNLEEPQGLLAFTSENVEQLGEQRHHQLWIQKNQTGTCEISSSEVRPSVQIHEDERSLDWIIQQQPPASPGPRRAQDDHPEDAPLDRQRPSGATKFNKNRNTESEGWTVVTTRKQKRKEFRDSKWSLFLVTCMLLIVGNQAENQPVVRCTNFGVQIVSHGQLAEYEVCTEPGECVRKRNPGPIEDVSLPAAARLNEHNLFIKLLEKDTNELGNIHVACPPVKICQAIACTWCAENILNPNCHPKAFLSLSALIIYLLGVVIYKIMGIKIKCRLASPAEWLGKALCFLWRKKKVVAKVAKKGRIAGRVGIQKVWLQGITLMAILAATNGCQTIVLQHSEIESCIDSNCTTIRHLQYALTPSGKQACAHLLNEERQLLKEIRVTWLAHELSCHKNTITFTRAVKHGIIHQWRCPHTGSCTTAGCAAIKMNDSLPELEGAKEFPGLTHCRSGRGNWLSGCGLPLPSCVFNKEHLMPITSEALEILRCDHYDEGSRVQIEVIDATTGIKDSFEMLLKPGKYHERGNLSIQIHSISLPVEKYVGLEFISSGNKTAMLTSTPSIHLWCKTAEDALKMSKCTPRPECECELDSNDLNCRCLDYDLSTPFRRLEQVLPIRRPNSVIENINGKITVSTAATGSLVLTVPGTYNKLKMLSENDECQATVREELIGCYNCPSGARMEVECTSTKGRAIADVDCDENQSFTIPCDPSGTTSQVQMHFDHSLISITCAIKCGSTRHELMISGKLTYDPIGTSVWVPSERGKDGNENVRWGINFDFKIPDVRGLLFDLLPMKWKLISLGILMLIVAVGGTLYLLWHNPQCVGHLLFRREHLGRTRARGAQKKRV